MKIFSQYYKNKEDQANAALRLDDFLYDIRDQDADYAIFINVEKEKIDSLIKGRVNNGFTILEHNYSNGKKMVDLHNGLYKDNSNLVLKIESVDHTLDTYINGILRDTSKPAKRDVKKNAS